MTTPPSPGHIFMSYSRKDEAVMRRIVRYLRRRGLKIWVDNEKLIPGTPIWEVEVEKAIVNSGAVVVLLSPDSKNSPWVRREISYAEDNEKRIFPILIAGDERNTIPIRLTTHQRIDLRQNEELGLNSLSAALSFYLEDLEIREQKAREETERLAREKAAKEKDEREAAEKAAKEKAERETAEKAAKEKAKREAAEKAIQEKAELEAAQKATHEKEERERLEREEKARKDKEATEKAALKRVKHKPAGRAIREQGEHKAAVREPHQKTTQKLQALWSKYVRVGYVIIFLIVVGGIWGISTYFERRNSPTPSKTPIVTPTDTPTPRRTPTVLLTDTSTPSKTKTATPTNTALPTNTPLPLKITIENASQVVERTQWEIDCSTGYASPVFSKELKFMACKSSDNSIHVYRVDDGSLFQTLKESGRYAEYARIAFSPDEQIIASADEGPIRLWDVNNGSLLRTINLSVPLRSTFTSLEFSPNGGILAAGELKDIRLFQINDGTELLTIKDRHSASIFEMVFSPDGETLASGTMELRLSRVNDGKLLCKFDGFHVRSLDISPDGSILASGWYSPDVIRLWQISDGNLLRTLSGHIGVVRALDFSPDGQLLASCGADGTIRLWRVSDGTLLNTLEGCSNEVAFSPDGTILASVTDEKMWLWEVAP